MFDLDVNYLTDAWAKAYLSGMILKKSFKFRLRPKREQEARFFQFAGARRWVYNRGLAQRKESWEKEHRIITLFDQNKELRQLKEQEETFWLKEVPLSPVHNLIGIDVGLQHFATIASEGEIEEVVNPRFLGRELKHLRYLSRSLSRKQYRSNSWRKAKAQLQFFFANVKHMRDDFLHKLSTLLVKSHDAIVVESLSVKSLLMKSHRGLARSISDAGWGRFLQMLKYKCEHFGKRLIEAEQYFPSTKQCSRCGQVNDIALSERRYRCPCGADLHRDHNAAINLRAVGMPVLKACGAAL